MMQFIGLMLCVAFGMFLALNGIFYTTIQFWIGLALFLVYGIVKKLEE